jgi:hypothetical protein
MTYDQAKEILDQVRQGQGHSISSATIRLALWHTGDARLPETVRSQGVDQEIPAQDWRARSRERAIMVGRSKE